jgi:glycosyltransferase involved in cell wall biosynthesis
MAKVSVIIPCYNQAVYLPETLHSVLDQTYSDWECIIVDDGSPDHTSGVAQEWTQKDVRFKYLKKPNGGVSDARNAGIRNATGEYILPLDSDDKISKDYMREAVAVLDADPEVRLVYSRARFFGVVNRKWRTADYSYKEIIMKNMIFCSAFYRKKDFDKTNGYNTSMITGWEDWDFWIDFLNEKSKVVRLDACHFFYRRKNASRNKSLTREQKERLYLQLFNNHREIYLRYLNPIKNYREYIYRKERKKQRRDRLKAKFHAAFLCLKSLTTRMQHPK